MEVLSDVDEDVFLVLDPPTEAGFDAGCPPLLPEGIPADGFAVAVEDVAGEPDSGVGQVLAVLPEPVDKVGKLTGQGKGSRFAVLRRAEPDLCVP